MALELYRKKRNFKVTPEPAGGAIRPKSQNLSYVIQKHAASHLHYDFRLELNGVHLSWAVPKGPSLDPNDKRLAMHVEDHPLEYGDFEGIIPAKQYGAGTVLLWDRGIWIPKEDPQLGYKKGKLKFDLDGEKLKGGWTLVKSHGGKYGGDKAWLLIKEDDSEARRGPEANAEARPTSVASGRTLEEIAADPDRVWHSNKSVTENVRQGAIKKMKPKKLDLSTIKGAVKAKLPAIVKPQLATLVKEPPNGPGWVHEIKYDGYRMLCRIEGGTAAVISRTGKDWTAEFSTIARAVARLPVDEAWIDGEIIAMEPDGRTSFQALQNALSLQEGSKLLYYAFDLLFLNGFDLRGATLIERKRALESLIGESTGTIRYSAHIEAPGGAFLEQACKLRLEGIISKRADSTYQATRSRSWLKIKCASRQEMVIGGFTDPEGSRQGFGALLLGVYEPDGSLRYSGKVGTGFNDKTLTSLRKTLDALEQDKPPFSNPPKGAEARRAHWVKPTLVAEVNFTEWTHDGTLRHPSFQGLRKDKKATEVVRERAVALEESEPEVSDGPGTQSPAKGSARKRSKKIDVDDQDTLAGIKLTNPDKLLYPEAGLSKRDLALYYLAVAEWIIPHLKGRPLSLVRCPNGWDKGCFYQKNADQSVHPAIGRVTVQTSDGPAQYMTADSPSALVALIQMGVLELHPWGSIDRKLGYPDRIIFDFDPDDELGWNSLTQAVGILRTLLEGIGLQGFLKTTGGKGLHVVVPIQPTLDWEQIKGFTKSIADLLTTTFPDRFTAKLTKSSRRGKIFVDYLRNAEGATAIAPYSMRAKANAPVAMPVGWKEINKDIRFDHFNVKNVPARLKRRKTDPWADFFEIRQTITPEIMNKVGYSG